MNNRGLTLIEILVVLGLFVIVAGLALAVSLDTYRDSSYHAARASLISALQHARAEALDDICAGVACAAGADYGVAILADRFVIFQGTSYASRDQGLDVSIETSPSIQYSGISQAVFNASSGDVTAPGDIMLTDTAGHISTITIGDEGQITWTN